MSTPSTPESAVTRRPEPRWPIIAALLVAIAMQFALPNRHVLSPTFLFPAVELLLLIVLVVAGPMVAHGRTTVIFRLTVASCLRPEAQSG